MDIQSIDSINKHKTINNKQITIIAVEDYFIENGYRKDVAEMCGIVEKGGAWYTVDGERFQGRAKAVQYLRENPKVVDKLIEEINAKS